MARRGPDVTGSQKVNGIFGCIAYGIAYQRHTLVAGCYPVNSVSSSPSTFDGDEVAHFSVCQASALLQPLHLLRALSRPCPALPSPHTRFVFTPGFSLAPSWPSRRIALRETPRSTSCLFRVRCVASALRGGVCLEVAAHAACHTEVHSVPKERLVGPKTPFEPLSGPRRWQATV